MFLMFSVVILLVWQVAHLHNKPFIIFVIILCSVLSVWHNNCITTENQFETIPYCDIRTKMMLEIFHSQIIIESAQDN